MAALAFDILVFAIGNAVLIMEFKTSNDLNRLFQVAATVAVVSMALSFLARTGLGHSDLEWSLGGNGFMSAALFGPACVFFVLKDTRASEGVKWAFFIFLIVSAVAMQYFADSIRD